MNTQEKFMQRMEDIAAHRQVDFVVDHSSANTGIAMFQHKGVFKPLVAFKFDFQTGYARFEGIPNPSQSQSGLSADKWFHVTPNELDRFVDSVLIALTSVGITVRSEPY